MKKEEVDKKYLQELISKYLNGETTLEELKLLVSYYESFQGDSIWKSALGNKEGVKARMLANILKEIQNKETLKTKIVPIYQRSFFKYAVAAFLLVLISLTFLLKNNDTKVSNTNVVKTIKPTINPGTNKATLTLKNGSKVVLGKGTNFHTQNAESHGEEIVYEKGVSGAEKIEYNYLTIPRGGQFFIKLSDGTQVWLNSESQLKYPVKFIQGQNRKVELVYGEAYFDVSPSTVHNGDAFLVFNKAQEVQVLGTEFNIKAYKDEAKVYTTLVEGKVAVSIDERKENLLPSQQLSLNKTNKTSVIKTVDVYNETSWKNGVFSFEDIPLKDMMKVLSRWYDVEVVIESESIQNEEFVGVLRKNQKLDEILMNIKNFGIIKNFEIYEEKVVIE
jgi:hypothetical protein